MRSEFEKLPEIAELLNDKEKEFFYNEDFDVYGTNPVNDFDAGFINGAWYAYQEQQKRIDAVLQICKSKHQKVDYWVDHFIDDVEELLK